VFDWFVCRISNSLTSIQHCHSEEAAAAGHLDCFVCRIIDYFTSTRHCRSKKAAASLSNVRDINLTGSIPTATQRINRVGQNRICTVFDRIFGDFSAKITVNTPYIYGSGLPYA